MASNLPFEVEDQTDEDFFDKLVDDDDDVVVSSVGLTKANDLVQGDDSDDAVNSVGLTKAVDLDQGDSDDGESVDVNAFANLSISDVDFGNVDLVPKVVSGNVDNYGSLKSVDAEATEEKVYDGEVNSSLPLTGSFSFDDKDMMGDTGLVSESSGSPGGGVKEVQWSAFSDSADLGSGGFGSYDDFLTDFGQVGVGNVPSETSAVFGNETISNATTEIAYDQTEQIANSVDASISTEYYENQYPGWKFDTNTGQWYQLDDTVGNATGQESVVGGGNDQWAVSDVNSSQVLYSQQVAETTVESISQISGSTTENVTDWSYSLEQNNGYQYPAHMIFDPQYPGWYYDTLAQEWRSLDTFHSTEVPHNQPSQDGLSGATYVHGGDGQVINDNALQVHANQGLNATNQTYATSMGQYNQPGSNDGQSEFGMNSGSSGWPSYDSNVYRNSQVDPHQFSDSRGFVPSYNAANQSLDSSAWAGSANNNLQPRIHFPQASQNGAVQHSTELFNNQTAANISQPFFSNGHHASYAPSETRTLTGRPPHALVTFGFGGKLLVMKDTSTDGFSLQGSTGAGGHSLSVLNLTEIVGLNSAPSGVATCTSSYFLSLCHQSFPGPLVGGNAGSKEINKWVDERIANCESRSGNDSKGESPKLLLSLLKIACQHKGKLRSSGKDVGLKENDPPESAVATLFASAKRNSNQFSQHGAKCLMTLPSEAHIQATALEVQNLLVSGRKKEALQCAQEGQFWEFALILAREIGDQFYADTVKQMAVSQLVTGSPLRTLCLLIAKRPEEVISNNVIPGGNLPGAMAMSPQHAQYVNQSAGYSMLANWEENLAVITANWTKDDHLVIIDLGDFLWKEKNDVTAAHICYLIAESGFELYSDTSRLCLIGTDHLNFPRTYASPEAIQRTELFEYAKFTGNTQFVLLPFQSYKFIYAQMLAEVGKVSDSLKYCQAVQKAIKTGISPEMDILKQLSSSLEERIRAHQESGYSAPSKFVNKIRNLFDSTAHLVVGGLPPPTPSTALSNGNHYQSPGSQVRSSQSTMGMSSLMPSASMEPINQWAGDGSKISLQNRSNSEPNIGRSPRPVDTSNEVASSSTDGKSPGSTADSKNAGSTRTSRFGRFLQNTVGKTVGLVLKSQGRQAKLGDSNKFYYDEKLKRWVEEGAEPPAEEPALAPPPITTTFQTEKSDNYSNNAFSNVSAFAGSSPEPASSTPPGSSVGIPSIPPSSNQFSARGRMGVRSRYVDTFNKGGAGTSTNMFQAPSIPSAQPAGLSSAKFFIPASSSQNQPTFGAESGSGNDASENEQKSSIPGNDPFQNLAPSPAGTIQRFPSVDNIPNRGAMGSGYSLDAPQSRRTASWSAFHNDMHTSPSTAKVKASPLSFMPPSNQSLGNLPRSQGSFGEDLHEVEL